MEGRVYYANHFTKSTQWTHPRTGKKKRVPEDLPYGWEKQITDEGYVLYVDHINQKTTYTDPRLAFAVEEKDPSNDIRQRFDASSTALQILNGRDLTGKLAIVTGSNCGIGMETARSLAFHGAHVVMACRNVSKAEEVIAVILKERPLATLETIELDLASLSSVKRFADEFKKRYRRLHILILNAGVFGLPHTLTEDGFEMTFQVNHLAHFYLTRLLQDVLVPSSPARIVVLSSESHRFCTLDARDVCEEHLSPTTASDYVAMFAYNKSKLCNVLFSNELDRRLSESGVRSNAVHPGNMVSSSLSRYWWPYRLLFAIVRPFTKSLQQACSTSIYCAVASELEGIGGSYFNNCFRCRPSKAAEDLELAGKVWEISERMVNAAIADRALRDEDLVGGF